MTQSKADPCVFFKLDDQGKLRFIVSITVDECSVAGIKEDIKIYHTLLSR